MQRLKQQEPEIHLQGCMLNFVLEKGLDDLTESDLAEMLIFANAGASLITTRRGALKVMPEKEEVLAFIASRS